MEDFQLRRLGMVMEPEAGNPNEVEGVLNPAAARGPDGALYLFPRLVAKGDSSRIGIGRVRFDDAGDPMGVDWICIALEPETDYERRLDGGGGCEDPRVTYVEPLQRYIKSYTAFSPAGPRIAFAQSENLFKWEWLGLATYAHWHGVELGNVDDKDASLFPVAIPNYSGQLELGMLHRPLFPGTRPDRLSRPEGNACWILRRKASGSHTVAEQHFPHTRALPPADWQSVMESVIRSQSGMLGPQRVFAQRG